MAHRKHPAPRPFTPEEIDRAPWLKWAIGEYEKGVHEIASDREFEQHLYLSLAQHSNPRFSLLNWDKLDREIASSTAERLAPVLMELGNPEIDKYFWSLKKTSLTRRDTLTDKKTGRVTGHEWRMLAWCAAFVNWCLTKAGVRPLGSAWAADWLTFGTDVTTSPPRGAIVVVKPSAATNAKGGSGHVAFYGGTEGDQIWIFGGNQLRRVCWMKKPTDSVRGYRWPCPVGDFQGRSAANLA